METADVPGGWPGTIVGHPGKYGLLCTHNCLRLCCVWHLMQSTRVCSEWSLLPYCMEHRKPPFGETLPSFVGLHRYERNQPEIALFVSSELGAGFPV